MRRLVMIVTAWMATAPGVAAAARIKDLVEVQGVRTNPIFGEGIVVGLAGTGDDGNSVLTRRMLASAMRHLGTNIDPADVKAKNVAAVAVTANLPPYARPGVLIDVTVSSMGSARSLQGGTLLVTSLRGMDRATYAIAQGSLSVGGFDVGGASGTAAKKNFVTAGRIPNGALVEREVRGGLSQSESSIVLMLREPDSTTAWRIAAAINGALGANTAQLHDMASVTVTVPPSFRGRTVQLIATLENLEAVADTRARVVIDERSGTIIVGAGVTLRAAAIAYGSISVNITEQKAVSQPGPAFGGKGGKTEVVPESTIDVQEADGRLTPIRSSATVAEVAKALNSLGLKPRDLVSVLLALKAAGALQAEIQVL